MDDLTWDGFRTRYDLIKRFHEVTRDLFIASLKGDADPAIANTVLAGYPPCRGREYHLKLSARQLKLPVFFRTDEAAPGAIVEIQCPGSGWDMVEQLRDLYLNFPGHFGTPKRFRCSLAKNVSRSLYDYLGNEPIIHHLHNNSSRPHGVRYFIQRCRDEGLRHFSWDSVHWRECNFIRGHDFYDLRYNNLFDDWMKGCEQERVFFDHPPTPLYASKIITAWPYWQKTARYYSDDLRNLFPYADIITPEGFHITDGSHVTLKDYCKLSSKKRNYYVKFASSDPTLNWGSRAVYYTGSLSSITCQQLFDRVIADRTTGRHWIIQEARVYPESTTSISRNGHEMTVDGYTKFSGHYGPSGLFAVLTMQDRSRKVHGTPQTVLSVVF